MYSCLQLRTPAKKEEGTNFLTLFCMLGLAVSRSYHATRTVHHFASSGRLREWDERPSARHTCARLEVRGACAGYGKLHAGGGSGHAGGHLPAHAPRAGGGRADGLRHPQAAGWAALHPDAGLRVRGSERHAPQSTDAAVLPVPPESWTVPSYVRLDAHPLAAPREYRLMGWWRLTFQMEFAAAMGHDYVLQTDGDLFLTRPLAGGSLVAQMRAARADMACYCDTCHRETADSVRGLPEFSAWFLQTRGLQPWGPVFRHTRPRDARGLYISSAPTRGRPSDGFDLESLVGHFIVLSMEMWARPVVADYVAAALRSGSVYEERWNEQAVQTWVRFLFVDDSGQGLCRAPTKRQPHGGMQETNGINGKE